MEDKNIQNTILDPDETLTSSPWQNTVTYSSYYGNKNRLQIFSVVATILALILIAIIAWLVLHVFHSAQNKKTTNSTQSSQFSRVSLDQLNLGQLGQLDVNGNLMVNGGLVLKPSTQPSSPTSGQIYLNSQDKKIYYYDGQTFRELASGSSSGYIAGAASGVTIGSGLRLQGNILSADTISSTPTSDAVTSVQGQSGNVVFTSGNGISVNGTQISNSGVTGINGLTGNVPIGRGLTTTGGTLASSMTLISGSPGVITVSDDGSGNYTISQVGSGSSGSVALGPTIAQTDASNFSSIFINKTGTGNLLQIQQNGTNRWVVNNSGTLTVGDVPFSRLSGVPSIVNALTDGTTTSSGTITVGTGLTLTGNTLTANNNGITTVNGTTNQVNASTSGGTVTLSLPQDINTTSTPSFSGLTLTNLSTAGIVKNNASGVLSTGQVALGSEVSGTLPIGSGGTNATTASGARTNLGAAASGANSDITSLSGLTTALSVGQGGTGATTAQGAINNLSGLSTAGDLLFHNGTNTTRLARGTNGQCLTSSATTIQWGSCGLTSEADTLATVTARGAATSTAVSLNGGATIAGVTVNNATVTDDQILLGITTGGATRFNGTITNADLTAARTWTLPDASGTFCLTSGNCAGVGGTGDILNNGQNGPVTIGTNDATALTLETNNTGRLSISSTGAVTVSNTLAIQGGNSLVLGTASTSAGAIAFNNAAGANSVSLLAPSTNPSSSFSLRLPSATGSNNDCLKVDGSGNLFFGGCAAAGSGVTSLNTLSGALSVANATASGSTITIDDATTTTKGIASFNSTNFSVSSGAVNTIQNIATTSSPTFAGATISGLSTAGIVKNNASGVLSTGQVALGSEVSGTLPIGSGGTNATTASGARTNLGAAASGANSDITSLSGLTTALSVGQGGTGATTLTQYGVLYGNGTGAIQATATGTTGQCLVATTSAAPTWGSCAGSGSGVTLQSAYNNSTNPELVLDSTRGGLTIRDNATPVGSNLLEIQNNNGTATYLSTNVSGTTINGNLTQSGGAISLTGNSASTISTTSGTLTITSATAATWGTTTGVLTLSGASGVAISTVGTADNNAVLCRNTSNILAACNSTFATTANAFLQNGNSFGATATLGTNDNNSLSFETNNQTQATIAAGGATTFKNTTDSTSAFQIQNTAGTSILTVDTTGSKIAIGSPNAYNVGIGGLETTGTIATGGNVRFTNTGSNNGGFSKYIVAGPTGASQNDVVVVDTSGFTASTTTIPRNTAVFGVNQTIGTTAAGANINVTTFGNATAGYTGTAPAIGDQLVTSTVAGKVIVDNNATTGIVGYAMSNGSGGNVSIFVNVDRGQYSPVFRNQTNSTAAFQIQDATATPVLTADTTANRISIGSIGNAVGQLYVSGIITAGPGTLASQTYLNDVAIQGNYAYGVTYDDNKFKVFDVTIPDSPKLISTTGAILSNPEDVVVQGKYAYIANYGTDSFQVLDISNPSNVTSVYTSGTDVGINPHQILLDGNYAYVVNYGASPGPGSITVYDISNPTSPRKISNFATGNGIMRAVLQGRYIYLITKEDLTLRIIDTSNPSSLNQVGSIGTVGSPTAMAVNDRFVYVATQSNPLELIIFDVKNPAAPVSYNIVTSPVGSDPQGMAISGKFVYVLTKNSPRLITFDTTYPDAPIYVGSTPLTAPGSEPYDLKISGQHAYIADYGAGALHTIDLGGAYIQSLKAGTLSATNLEASNVNVNSSLKVSGAVNISDNLQVVGSIGVGGPATFQNITNSVTAFQIQNATTSNNAQLFLADTTNVNLLANSSAEADALNWAITTGSGAAPSSSATNALFGTKSLQANTSATTNAGVKYNTTTLLSASTTYSLSFYAKIGSGTFTVQAGRSDTDVFGGETTCTLSSTTVSTTWTRFTCSFATGATVTTGGYIFIRQSDAVTRTWYIDGVQLEQAAASTNYREGKIQINGTVTSPIIFQNQADSNQAFQVQNAAGTSVLRINTANMTTGWNVANAALYVAKDATTNRSINAAGTVNASGADYAEWIPWSGDKPESGSIIEYNGSHYIVSSPETAAFVGNDRFNIDESILVTFAGQVPVRVIGQVNIGDILIDNGDGTAKAVSPATATIGELLSKVAIAQEANNDSAVKLVKASVGTTSSNMASALQNQSAVFADITVGGTAQLATLNVSGTATISSLTVTGNVNIGGTLNVTGSATFAGNITVNGHIITGGNTPTASVGDAVLTGQGGSVTVAGNDTAGNVQYLAGTINLPTHNLASGKQLGVTFSSAYATTPRVSLTAKNAGAANVRYFVETTTTGFSVHFIDTPTANVTYSFDYLIIQ